MSGCVSPGRALCSVGGWRALWLPWHLGFPSLRRDPHQCLDFLGCVWVLRTTPERKNENAIRFMSNERHQEKDRARVRTELVASAWIPVPGACARPATACAPASPVTGAPGNLLAELPGLQLQELERTFSHTKVVGTPGCRRIGGGLR